MKKKKLLAVILAGLAVQYTTVFASSDTEVTDEDVNNMTPGWSNSDKRISDYKQTNTNDMFSLNGSNDTNSDSDKKNSDNKSNDETTFDQIIGESNDNNDTQEVGNIKYTLNSTGGVNSYWGQIEGGQWILIENGSPAVGWRKVKGNWYYMNTFGIMQTGWINYKNKWYYLYSNGVMAANKWVGGYYVGSDGAMR